MHCFLQVFCAVFSGLLLALAIPNELYKLGSPVIGLLSLAPLYLSVTRAKDYNEAFRVCALQALVCHLTSSYWLAFFQGFAIFTLGASALGTAGYHGLFGLLYFWLYSKQRGEQALMVRAGRREGAEPLRVLWFASLYTVWEWCKSNGFLGYPWGTVSMTAFRVPLITQIADVTGSYGVTFLFAFFAASLAEGVELLATLPTAMTPRRLVASWRSTFAASLALLALALCYGAVELLLPRAPVKTLNAVLVQQNLDPWFGGEKRAISISERLTDDAVATFAARGIRPDVVVWSEAVLNKGFPDATNHYTVFPNERPLIPFIRETALPFIIGGRLTMNEEKNQYGNAALLFGSDGVQKGAYVKLHLVPFAERIPGVQYDWVRTLMKRVIGFSYGWTQGYKAVLFDLPLATPPHYDAERTHIVSLTGEKQERQTTALVGTPICFDDAFGEVCRRLFLAGSEVFLNLTNDSWSRTDSAELQHFVVASYRAIEYRTTLARATNAGFTCVVSPTGKVLQSLALFTEGALATQIPVYERRLTIYARLGDWLPKTLALLATAFLCVVLLREHDERTEIATAWTAMLGVWFQTIADMGVWDY